jgi:hypothetical protein
MDVRAALGRPVTFFGIELQKLIDRMIAGNTCRKRAPISIQKRRISAI